MVQHLINWVLAILVALLLGASGGAHAEDGWPSDEMVAKALTTSCMFGSIQTSLRRGVTEDQELVMTSIAICAPLLLDVYKKMPTPPSKERQVKFLIDQGLSILRNIRYGRAFM